MATLTYAQRFFRGGKHLSASEHAALRRTLRAMEGETLPGPDDTQTLLPPSMACWRRRIEASDRYVYFIVRDDGSVTLIAVGGLI